MKKLSNTEAEPKKSVAYKKSVYLYYLELFLTILQNYSYSLCEFLIKSFDARKSGKATTTKYE